MPLSTIRSKLANEHKIGNCYLNEGSLKILDLVEVADELLIAALRRQLPSPYLC